jgi:hypothetical protein
MTLRGADYAFMEWKPINTVPLDRDVEIAIIDSKGVHVVACPCRLTHHGWIAADSKRRLYRVRPHTLARLV